MIENYNAKTLSRLRILQQHLTPLNEYTSDKHHHSSIHHQKTSAISSPTIHFSNNTLSIKYNPLLLIQSISFLLQTFQPKQSVFLKKYFFKSLFNKSFHQLSKSTTLKQILKTFNLFNRKSLIPINNNKHVHFFNMIEILIGISIIVTFSGLTGAVLAQVYEESRVSNALLDLAKLQEGLVLYYTRHGKYPLALEDLLQGGELNKVPKDPWGTDYVYVPHLDWNRLNRILTTTSSSTTLSSGSIASSSQQLAYYVEVLKRMENVLLTLPTGISPMSILAIANEQPFCICVGTKIPRFPSKIDIDVSRERIRYVANLMKMAVERSSYATGGNNNNAQQQQGGSSLMNQFGELHNRMKSIVNIAKNSGTTAE
ncbi:hypothetical protein ABK040_005818 [Willaertia magna]